MSSLLDKIRQNKLARETERPKITTADINIKGSGLTKREAEKNTRAYDRETAKSIKEQDSDLVREAEENLQHSIEDTLEIMRRENAKNAIQLDESQLRALVGIIHNRVSCLIGAAGTGKTTVTKMICDELAKIMRVVKVDETMFVTCESADGEKFRCLLAEAWKQNYKILTDVSNATGEMPGIAFAAYTGRASQQIKRAIPQEWHRNISTIHSLLGYAPVFEDYEWENPFTHKFENKVRKVFRPTFDENCKLPYTFYVFDEASMIPIPLWNEAIAAMPPNARILVIGDIHQLPPPYGKGVLGFAMRKWPVFELTHIHRQAAGNAIIKNAHNVLNSRPLENASNFHMIGNDARVGAISPTGQSELSVYFLNVIKKLSTIKTPNGEFAYDPIRDNVIVPSNKGLCGTKELNEKMVVMFNPEEKDEASKVIVNKRMKIHTGNNFVYFAMKDKVMITKNVNTEDPPITNGMLGIVESININGRYDQKRSQLDDSDNTLEITEEDETPLEIDLDSLNFKLTQDDSDEKEDKKADESSDQRQASHVMVIRFENGQSYECSTAGDYRSVTHGYATTCHKAQGGEYPNIIILCHSINAVMLTQEWLYTAITRARNNVYIVCNSRGLSQAIKRQVIAGKTLQEKIRSYIIEMKIDDETGEKIHDPMKHPILWEPEEV